MRCTTLGQIFADVPEELFSKRVTARVFNRSGKSLGGVEATICRNGSAFWMRREDLYCGRVIEGDYYENEGA